MIVLRAPTSEDAALIVDAWSKSASGRLSRTEREVLPPKAWHAVIRAMLGTSRIVVAERNQDVIGFAVASTDQKLIHYVYVKKDHRLHGIARAMLEKLIPRTRWHGLTVTTLAPVPLQKRAFELYRWRFAPLYPFGILLRDR